MHLPIEALILIQVMFWSTFIALQHLLTFKYHVDKKKHVKFLFPIHQTKIIKHWLAC